MLSRKCGKNICELLVAGDYNVQITITEKIKSRFVQKSFVEWSWKQLLINTIGVEILNDSINTYLINYETERYMGNFATEGHQIIEECWKHLQNVDVVRISITKCPSEKNKIHTWIIARE
ncbi:MAG: hypothetical protein PHD15_07270 [Clostridia bacterium]|nr:hypothetical protein [Clostridia bacterium]MDD4387530.1 hypothetical protein [Clostridia bacterium]